MPSRKSSGGELPGLDTRDAPELVKISELARLGGVPTATVKYYIREGLLPGPARRTSRNMAYYDPRLCHRIRAIKELQQTRFLPLKVIADLLEPAPSACVRTDLDEFQRRQLGIDAAPLPVGASHDERPADEYAIGRTDDEVLATTTLAAEDLDALAKMGAAEPALTSTGARVYRGADLEIVKVLHEARAHGMGELFPVDVLSPYAEAIDALVRMELDLFRRRVLSGAALPDMELSEIVDRVGQLSQRLVMAMREKSIARQSKAATGPMAHRRHDVDSS